MNMKKEKTSQAMPKKSVLFRPINIASLPISNRFVRSATHDFMADESGFVTDRQVALFDQLARGEVGLIITGHSFVDPRGKASLFQTAVHDDRFIAGLQRITETVHRTSSRIFLQIAHAGRQTKEKFAGGIPLAPSAVREPVFKLTPHPMSTAEIRSVIQAFIAAARRARDARFDGIQLHLAHGYLLSSFLSPYTNRRRDAWGGPLENRLRIATEIIAGIRDLVGSGYPLTVKLNTTDLLPSGLEIEEAIQAAVLLEKAGVHAIEVSGGMSEAGKTSIWKGPFKKHEEGYFVENAARVKSVVSIPVMGLGGFRSFEIMERAVREGKADLISLSRPLIREPDLVLRYRTGLARKSECISCNRCFNPRGIDCGDLKRKKIPTHKDRQTSSESRS